MFSTWNFVASSSSIFIIFIIFIFHFSPLSSVFIYLFSTGPLSCFFLSRSLARSRLRNERRETRKPRELRVWTCNRTDPRSVISFVGSSARPLHPVGWLFGLCINTPPGGFHLENLLWLEPTNQPASQPRSYSFSHSPRSLLGPSPSCFRSHASLPKDKSRKRMNAPCSLHRPLSSYVASFWIFVSSLDINCFPLFHLNYSTRLWCSSRALQFLEPWTFSMPLFSWLFTPFSLDDVTHHDRQCYFYILFLSWIFDESQETWARPVRMIILMTTRTREI